MATGGPALTARPTGNGRSVVGWIRLGSRVRADPHHESARLGLDHVPEKRGRLMPDRTTMKAAPSTLVEGQRLDQPTFHALYEAMPPGTRAELIDGVVYMPSPVGRAHGRAQLPVLVWLDYYAENTPGTEVLDNATTILGWRSEPQPDGLLRILPECGGRTWDEGEFVSGAPELVVEVSKATRYVDLGSKKAD